MTITCYQLAPGGATPLDVSASTLDELTRALPQGFYTTFTTLAGGTKALGLRDHLRRLYVPAQTLGLTPAVDEPTLRRHLAALAKENLPDESRVRLIMSKDQGEVYVALQPFTPLPQSVYENGVHVVTTEMARRNPRIKGTDFIAQSAELRKLVKDDVFEVLLTRNGGILEGMTSNFYAVRYVIARAALVRPKQSPARSRLLRRRSAPTRNDMATLVTAQRGILPGVTRRAILKLARGEGMSIEYRPPRLDEDSDEAFLTSSSRGVVPVVKMDGKPVGQGTVGAWTKTLSLAYQAYVRERSESIAG